MPRDSRSRSRGGGGDRRGSDRDPPPRTRDDRDRDRGERDDRDRGRRGEDDRDRRGRSGDRREDERDRRGRSGDRREDGDGDGGFKVSIEGPGATPPSNNTKNCYRAVVEMPKPGDRDGNLGRTGNVRMTCAWQGDKRTAERDADKLKRAWRKGGFDEVQRTKGQLRSAARK
mmetsp:Transcript_17184/g.45399  ORF Transcript_17184/g.45399 Transcript_17184/m.45399 type:complete len:172 (-) Transcript_17184:160-675(-)